MGKFRLTGTYTREAPSYVPPGISRTSYAGGTWAGVVSDFGGGFAGSYRYYQGFNRLTVHDCRNPSTPVATVDIPWFVADIPASTYQVPGHPPVRDMHPGNHVTGTCYLGNGTSVVFFGQQTTESIRDGLYDEGFNSNGTPRGRSQSCLRAITYRDGEVTLGPVYDFSFDLEMRKYFAGAQYYYGYSAGSELVTLIPTSNSTFMAILDCQSTGYSSNGYVNLVLYFQMVNGVISRTGMRGTELSLIDDHSYPLGDVLYRDGFLYRIPGDGSYYAPASDLWRVLKIDAKTLTVVGRGPAMGSEAFAVRSGPCNWAPDGSIQYAFRGEWGNYGPTVRLATLDPDTMVQTSMLMPTPSNGHHERRPGSGTSRLGVGMGPVGFRDNNNYPGPEAPAASAVLQSTGETAPLGPFPGESLYWPPVTAGLSVNGGRGGWWANYLEGNFYVATGNDRSPDANSTLAFYTTEPEFPPDNATTLEGYKQGYFS